MKRYISLLCLLVILGYGLAQVYKRWGVGVVEVLSVPPKILEVKFLDS